MKKTLIVAATLLALVAQPVAAEEAPTGEELLARLDAALLDAYRDYEGNPAELLAGDEASKVHDIAREVFDGRWGALKSHSDQLFDALEHRPADYDDVEPVYVMNQNGDLAVAFRVAGVGSRVSHRLWDPEAFADLFSGMAIGKFTEPQTLALSAVLGGLTARRVFKTDFQGAPAIGVESGLWTTIIEYERDVQGHFLPLAIRVYERQAG